MNGIPKFVQQYISCTLSERDNNEQDVRLGASEPFIEPTSLSCMHFTKKTIVEL